MKRIHILRPGTFASVSAGDVTLTKADLIDLAASFSADKSKAPIVVGHPKLNAPAFGWVKALESDDQGNVYAVPDQVNPQFAELVKAGTYKTVSASLLPPTHASNPTPGKWSLRHLGFLGGHAPAIAGLEGVEFGAEDKDVLTVEFGAYDMAGGLHGASRLLRRLRDWLIGDKGLEVADQVMPDWDVKSVEDAARSASHEASQSIASFAAPAGAPATQESNVTKDTVDHAAREQALANREAVVAEGEAKIAAAAKAAHRSAIVDFADSLIAKGQLLPAHKAVIVDLAVGLDASTTVDFGEGDGKTSATPLDAFKGFLSALPKQVPVGEVAKADNAIPTADFAAPAGAQVSVERLELHSKAKAYQQQHGGEYLAAVKAVGG